MQHTVQDMLLIEQKPNYKLYAKSGWGMDLEPQVGWAEQAGSETATGEKVYFALNMHMKTGISASVREQLVKQKSDSTGNNLSPQRRRIFYVAKVFFYAKVAKNKDI